MQATLLGLSVAIILALVAALVGPHFVDWTQYRAHLRDRGDAARRPCRCASAAPIDVRLLPTPTLTLGQRRDRRRRAAAGARARTPRRTGARIAGARRISRLRTARRPARKFRSALAAQRAARLAGRAHRVRSGSAADREGRDRGRPHRLRRRRERHAGRARRVLVQGRSALAARAGEGRGRLHLGRRALRLSPRGEPRRRRRQHEDASSASIRPIIRSRSRPTARCGFEDSAPRFDGTLTLSRPAAIGAGRTGAARSRCRGARAPR